MGSSKENKSVNGIEQLLKVPVSRRDLLKAAIGAALAGTTAGGIGRQPAAASPDAQLSQPPNHPESPTPEESELFSNMSGVDVIQEDSSALFPLDRSDQVTVEHWGDLAKFIEDPEIVGVENLDSEIDASRLELERRVYHLKFHDHLGEELEMSVEVRRYMYDPDNPDSYQFFMPGDPALDVAQEVLSYWYTTDGKPVRQQDVNQQGIAVYHPVNHLRTNQPHENEDPGEKMMQQHAKHLFPEAVKDLIEVSGLDKWHEHMALGSSYEKGCYAAWLFASGDAPRRDYALVGITAPDLPSIAGGWYSAQVGPLREPGINFIEDILAHEIAHAALLFVGSQQMQECLGQTAQVVHGIRMAEQGLVNEQLPNDLMHRVHFSPFRYMSLVDHGVNPGEVVAHLPYDVNFFLYMLMEYAESFDIDVQTAFDEDLNYKPETVLQLWDRFVEGCYYIRELVSDDDWHKIFTALYEVSPGNNYSFINSSVADRSIPLAAKAYELKKQGSNDWRTAVEYAQKTSRSPLNSVLNDYMFQLFNPQEQKGLHAIQHKTTAALEALSQSGSEPSVFEHLNPQENVFKYSLGKRSQIVRDFQYPNQGYPIAKAWELSLLDIATSASRAIPVVECVLTLTDEARFVKIAVRNASGSFYREMSLEHQPRLELFFDNEQYYVFMVEDDENNQEAVRKEIQPMRLTYSESSDKNPEQQQRPPDVDVEPPGHIIGSPPQVPTKPDSVSKKLFIPTVEKE